MLNEDKIKLMTSIAIFEKREGKKVLPAIRYFKSDYISSGMLKSFFCYTFSFVLGIAVWVLYNIDHLLNETDTALLLDEGRRFIFLYLAGLAVYLVITFRVYARRYAYASRSMRVYVAKLKRLDKRYEFQNKTKELAKGGRPHDESTRF